MAPLVSVIVPVYNVSPYLRQCMDSIVNQTLKDIEIICVDDGSTDDSLAILQEYAEHDSRITILQQENKGGGAARNLGMTKATGKYLSFLDSDDFFETNMLNEMYYKITIDNSDICVCDFRRYYTNKKKYSNPTYLEYSYLPKNNPFTPDEIGDKLFLFSSVAVWTKLYSKNFILMNNIKFQEINRHNDAYFCVHSLLSAKKISIVPKVLGNYRKGNSSSLQSTNDKTPLDFYTAYHSINQLFLDNCVSNEIKFGFIQLVASIFIQQLIKLKNSTNFKLVYSKINSKYYDEFYLSAINWKKFIEPWVYYCCSLIHEIKYITKKQWVIDYYRYFIHNPILNICIIYRGLYTIIWKKITRKYYRLKYKKLNFSVPR